ncbi:uncharacterized protein HaLaN_14102 [Haematococcus lacustris]|uniref:EF-hand domain-containing protein n=1 Tax=Haematococcus lacustris TaxID=44745 RepID=A0A699ZF00_HAELA|nr:uncharacterized protein HaLaN_14102 [Haematococcus lacustris]
MDKDGDGVLSLRELRDALTQRGISTTDKTAKLLLERADLDGSGGVDYLEFLASTVHLARLERDERMWRAFRHFDTADTGFISRENLVQGLAHMGTKVDVDKILAEVDQDGDGKICYNEFCNMLRHQPEPAALSTFANDGAVKVAAAPAMVHPG